MRLTVFGKTGQVATELQQLVKEGLDITTLSRDEADLSDPTSCAKIISERGADVVINTAAYTAVDKAEEEENLANLINGDAPTAMARSAAECGIPFIHISTEYVFDGSGTTPWQTDDPARPLGAYGRSKLKGEVGVSDSGGEYIILRTSWIFSAYGVNFLKTMLHLSETRDRISIVADQIGAPTAASDVAKACLIVAQAFYDGLGVSGIYHYASTPDVSWADFAREIFEQTERDVIVEDIPTSSYPTQAKRPENSRINCCDLTTTYGIERPDWRESLTDVLKEMSVI